MHVHVDNPGSVLTEEIEPQHANASNQILATAGAPTEIVQLDLLRKRANIMFSSTSAPAPSFSGGGGAVVPAGAGTVIATAVAPAAGLYNVAVNTNTQGAVAGDHNNMGLYLNGVLFTILPVLTSGNADQNSNPVNMQLAAGDTLTVRQIAATTSTDYYAIITGNLIAAAAFQVIICHSYSQAQKALASGLPTGEGSVFTGPGSFTYESTAPLWAVPVGGAAVTAGVMAEKRDR